MTIVESGESSSGGNRPPRDDLHLLELTNWEDMNVLPSCDSYKLVGRDTDRPLLSVDGVLFEGSKKEVMGTNLYFCMKDGKATIFGSGTKKTMFHRVTAVKKDAQADQEPPSSQRVDTKLRINLDAMADEDLSAAMASKEAQ